jgi:hypothetical protein
MLMQYWLDYDEAYMRKAYRENKAIELRKPKLRRQDLYDIGYTDEDIETDKSLVNSLIGE